LAFPFWFGVVLWHGPAAAQTPAPPPGTLDAGFNAAINSLGTVHAVAVQGDGKIVIGGDFRTVNGVQRNYLARLNADGSTDAGFAQAAGADDTVYAIAVRGDGRVVVGGDFGSINGASWRGVARLNTDGTPDPTFGQYSSVNGQVAAVSLQPDGKILLGGKFTRVNGVTRNYLARLNADGSLDTGFNAQADYYVYALALRPDGRILVGGEFEKMNNVSRKYIAQLNADGAVDGSFNAELDWKVQSIALQTNGQAVIGGAFSRVNGFGEQGLARLHADGSRDSTFTGEVSGTVNAVVLQPNGRIAIAGRFSAVNGTPRNNVARVNPNGLLDVTFDPAAGPDSGVKAMALQADGKLIIGGEFTTVNFIDRTYVARLLGDPPPAPMGQEVQVGIWTAVEIGWNTEAGARYQVQWSPEAAPTQWRDFGEPVVGTGSLMRLFDSTREGARRFYRVVKVE
jgi:uncharacterized delta-60 repeat protein